MTALEAVVTSSDELLFLAFAVERDTHALGELFRRRAPELLRLASRWAPPGDAEDLVQATFVTAIRDSAAYDGRRRVMPWLCGILKNHAKHARRQQRRAEPVVDAAIASDPQAAMLRQEIVAALHRGLANMGPPYREVLDLHLHHDLDSREIARKLGRKPVAVRKQLSRAYRLLRAAFPIGLALGATVRVTPGQAAIAALQQLRAARVVPATGSVLRRRTTWFVAASAAASLAAITWTFANDVAEVSAPVVEQQSAESVTPKIAADAAVQGAASEHEATMRTVAASVAIRASVVHRDGSPAAGARLRATPLGELPAAMRSYDAHLAVADADGVATFDVPAGAWLVAPIEEPLGQRADTASGSTRELTLVVDGPFVVRGRVVDAERRPIAGASVFASDSGCRADDGVCVATTATNGEFEFVAVTRSPKLFARAAGHAASACERRGDRTPSELRLRGAAREVSVRVVDEAGAPVRGAHVALVPRQRDLEQVPLSHRRTDAAGIAVVADFPLDAGAVVVRSAASAPLLLECPAGADAIRLDATLRPGGTLVGTATPLDPSLRAPRVYATSCDVPDDAPVSQLLQVGSEIGADGAFELVGLPPGELVVRVMAERCVEALRRQSMPLQFGAATVHVESGVRQVLTMTLRRPTAVVGHALSAGGAPLVGWTICATESGLAGARVVENLAFTASSDERGGFTLRGLANGVDYDVAAYPPDARAGDRGWLPASVVRHRGGDDGLVVTAPAALEPATVAVFADAAVDEVALVRSGTRHRVVLAKVGDGGSFVATGVFVGDHLVDVVDRVHGRRLFPLTVAAGRTNEFRVPAPLPPARCVVTADRAHRRFHARLLDEHGIEHARVSGAESLDLGVVAPGRYRLQTYGRTLAANVREVHLTSGVAPVHVDTEPSITREIVFPFRTEDNLLQTVPSMVVMLHDDAGRQLLSESVRANAAGAFRVAVALAPGRYVATAVTSWGSRATLPMVIAGDATPPFRCALTMPE